MVTITNTRKVNRKGEHLYRLQINRKLVCEFWHKQTDGLSVCLLRASNEVAIAETRKPKETST